MESPPSRDVEGAPAVGPAWGARLVVVLVVLMATIAVNRVASALWTPYVRPRPTVWTNAVFYAEHGTAYLCAGLLVDGFGLKRVVGLALIGWSSLIMVCGAAYGPSGLGGVYLLVVLVFGVIHVAPHAAVKHGIRSGATALALTIPLVASYLWLAAIPSLRFFETQTRPANMPFGSGAVWFALVFATIAAFITMIWLISYRDRGVPDAGTRHGAFDQLSILLADRRIWTLLLLWGLTAIIMSVGEYRLLRFLEVQRRVNEGTVGLAIYYPYVTATVGALVTAGWSDRILWRTGSLAQARRPFAIAAFGLSAALGLVPLVRQTDLIAMSCIASAGIGMQFIIDVIVIDVAPARSVATVVGLMAAFGSLVRFATTELAITLYLPARSFVPILVFGALAGVAGAVASHLLLRRITPIEDPAADRNIPAIFA